MGQRELNLIRTAAFGTAAVVYVALLASNRANKKYGPRPLAGARRMGSDVAEPWIEAVLGPLGLYDHVHQEKADFFVDAVVAGGSALDQILRGRSSTT
jgi:hypothetical protein